MDVKLTVGDSAPVFSALNQYGKQIDLLSFKGKTIVLFFYPKDNTPGCTSEVCSLRDSYTKLLDKSIVLLGISTDSLASHLKFSDKFQLPFDILVDENKEIVNAYGVYVDKQMYGKTYKGVARTTFILNQNLQIGTIIDKVNVKDAANQILAVL